MLPFKESNRLNYVYSMWLNLPKNYVITLPTTTWCQVHSFQIDWGEGGRNSSWTLTKGIFKSSLRNCFKLGKRLQQASNNGKILRYLALHFFYFSSKGFFLPRFKQRWCFKMGPLSSLSLLCTEYLMYKNNTNGVKLKY